MNKVVGNVCIYCFGIGSYILKIYCEFLLVWFGCIVLEDVGYWF